MRRKLGTPESYPLSVNKLFLLKLDIFLRFITYFAFLRLLLYFALNVKMTNADCAVCISKDKEIENLKKLLKEKEEEIHVLKTTIGKFDNGRDFNSGSVKTISEIKLSSEEILRYSRQLILPQFGVEGQKRLKASSVLIVGAGGLGCPVGLYLTAAGIGKIGIVDYDSVDLSNLHRQVLHTEVNISTSKCQSFMQALKKLNSGTILIPHEMLLNSKNAIEIMKDYDIIIDASDNVPTRYLLNDASCLLKKPLVSGSALRFEGQLVVYNYGKSPCYRCLYSKPPDTTAVTSCSEGGVVGAVTGVIGCLQALEVMKILIGLPVSYENKLLIFDAESGQFRTVKLRGKNPNCCVCSDSPTITKLIDYEFFCKSSATDKVISISLLEDKDRISCIDYKNILANKIPHVLLDVRPCIEFQICSLPSSINIPFKNLINNQQLDFLQSCIINSENKMHFVICRRGNDSQKAVQFLNNKLKDFSWRDIRGGLEAWHNEVDSNFPVY